MLLGHFSLSYSTLSLADIFLGKKKGSFLKAFFHHLLLIKLFRKN